MMIQSSLICLKKRRLNPVTVNWMLDSKREKLTILVLKSLRTLTLLEENQKQKDNPNKWNWIVVYRPFHHQKYCRLGTNGIAPNANSIN